MRVDLDGDTESETATDEAEDALILDKLGAAREWAEGVTGLFLAPRTVEMTLERFPCARWFELEGGPIREVESIEYVDEDGATQTLAGDQWSVNDYVTPRRIDLAFGASWPTVRRVPNSIRVLCVVGYGTIPDTPPDVLALPKDIKAALLLTLGHLYENREDSTALALESIPSGAYSLLSLKRESLGV